MNSLATSALSNSTRTVSPAPSPIRNALDSLSGDVLQLEERLSRLGERLTPVLRPVEPQQSGATGTGPDRYLIDVADEISDLSLRAQRMSSFALSLIDRLGV